MRAGTGETRGADDGGCSAPPGAGDGLAMPDLTGLKNVAGATCYYYSKMQCLYHTPRFREAIVETSETAQQPSATLRALAGNVARMSSKAARPATLDPAIVGEFFGGNRRAQQDAEEFFAMRRGDMRGRE